MKCGGAWRVVGEGGVTMESFVWGDGGGEHWNVVWSAMYVLDTFGIIVRVAGGWIDGNRDVCGVGCVC